MGALLELARVSLSALRPRHDRRTEGITAAGGDPYARRRLRRLDELEAAGKCLARSGKHANLRYWPSERGSRILAEHRGRRQLTDRAAVHLS